MFPPSLHKNIRELGRQISLLEMECESIEPEKIGISLQTKSNSKPILKELQKKPFITGPSFSTSFYSGKKTGETPVGPKIYSASCAQIKTTNMKIFRNEKDRRETIPPVEEPEKYSAHCKESITITKKEGSSGDESTMTQKGNTLDKEKPCVRSMSSIKEVSESSDDISTICNTKNWFSNQIHTLTLAEDKTKKNEEESKTRMKILRESRKSKEIKIKSTEEGANRDNTNESNTEEERNSMEGCIKENESLVTPRDRQRRARSARTRTNSVDKIDADVTLEKALHEKEIQCMLWDEEGEKAEFLVNLNDSIRTLHLLTTELKRNSTQEKKNDVISVMQNTLLKIGRLKSTNANKNPLNDVLGSMAKTNPLQNDSNKDLFGVKHFCDELSDEKLVMSDELSAKNRIISTFENKEIEYLSLISNLKFNLEKTKQEADEGHRAKRDLKILQNKLEEETKVIEALKKSHGKMQELIQNYVLTNDKLRTELKLAKLESHKFNVLLAGKNEEINKYKEEMQSFQRHITQQLNLLRSKASEKEVRKAVEHLSNQATFLRDKDLDSCFSRKVLKLDDPNKNLVSTWTAPLGKLPQTITNSLENEKIELKMLKIPHEVKKPEPECATVKSFDQSVCSSKDTEEKLKDGYKSCQSDDSDPEMIGEDQTQKNESKHDIEIKEIIRKSTLPKESIDDILNALRNESSERFWSSTTTSFDTSQDSAHSSTEGSTSELS